MTDSFTIPAKAYSHQALEIAAIVDPLDNLGRCSRGSAEQPHQSVSTITIEVASVHKRDVFINLDDTAQNPD